MYKDDVKNRLEDLGERLPQPKGYKVLLAIPEVSEKTDGGVFLPDDIRSRENKASMIGLVVSMGDDAYGDKKRFPSGPWCKTGDWVVIRSYAGTAMVVQGQDFRLINDDSVEAVVRDPREIKRI